MRNYNNYFNLSVEKIADNFLSNNEYGQITVKFPSGRKKNYIGKLNGYKANIILNNYNLFYKLIKKGSIGLAESYMDGDFNSSDLSILLLFARQNELSYLKKRQAKWFYNLIIKFRHYLNYNSKKGSKKNISYHYDLGNSFYECWLDNTMTYSSAIFEKNIRDLEQAQINKYNKIVEPLNLNDNSKILEIGCGWGGFSTFAAKKFGAKIKAITISKEQYNFASKKIANEGLNEKISLEMKDYRDIEEKYSNIVSIEMFEAVGKQYWHQFFEKIKNSLYDDGLAIMQIITIDNQKAYSYQNNPDFIQQYIFPGGILPSKEQLKSITNSINLRIEEYKSFNSSYVQTLNFWNDKFQNSWNQIAKQGFSLRFKRMWEYYLCYCKAGFISESTDVSQFVLKK